MSTTDERALDKVEEKKKPRAWTADTSSAESDLTDVKMLLQNQKQNKPSAYPFNAYPYTVVFKKGDPVVIKSYLREMPGM